MKHHAWRRKFFDNSSLLVCFRCLGVRSNLPLYVRSICLCFPSPQRVPRIAVKGISRHNFRPVRFYRTPHILNLVFIVKNTYVECLVVLHLCRSRFSGDRQADTQTNYCNPRSRMRRGLIMRRRFCSDVRVHRSACCWTDDHMVKGKIQLQLLRKQNRGKSSVPLAVHLLGSKERREEFQKSMSQSLMQDPCEDGGTPEGKWKKLKRCIMETAEESLGRERKKQPDWFTEATDELTPLISAKQQAYCTFLQTPTSCLPWH